MSTLIINADRPVYTLPGMRHRTLAGATDGLERLEVWLQSLDPGAVTPPHYHECEEVVVILSGTGQLLVDGQPTDFGPGTTLVAPTRVVHQILNTGGLPIELLASLTETPARVFLPDGSLLPLPWQNTSAKP